MSTFTQKSKNDDLNSFLSSISYLKLSSIILMITTLTSTSLLYKETKKEPLILLNTTTTAKFQDSKTRTKAETLNFIRKALLERFHLPSAQSRFLSETLHKKSLTESKYLKEKNVVSDILLKNADITFLEDNKFFVKLVRIFKLPENLTSSTLSIYTGQIELVARSLKNQYGLKLIKLEAQTPSKNGAQK